jgi:hypothetical protein
MSRRIIRSTNLVNPTDLRCLLNALAVACPELTTRLSEMGPVPLAHLGTLSHAEAWPVDFGGQVDEEATPARVETPKNAIRISLQNCVKRTPVFLLLNETCAV